MNFIEEFIKKESSSGILLIIATILALTLKNSMFSEYYSAFLRTPVEVRFADLHIAKPLLLWINDGLMAIFFLLIGLEVKREFLEGRTVDTRPARLTRHRCHRRGVLVPALFYTYINLGDETAMLRLGDPDRHRYRLRTRHTGIVRQTCTAFTQGFFTGPGNHR